MGEGKMKKLLFAYCMMVAILSAQQATVEYESEREILETTLFQNNDTEVTTNVCEARCRVVKDGYTTQITHFDAKTGITSCGVYRRGNLDNPIQFTADTINRKCIELTNQNVSYGSGQLVSEGKEESFKEVSTVTYSETKLGFSRMMTGLVTLDPEIVNFKETNRTGLIKYAHESDVYGASIVGLDSGSGAQYVATVDSLNKANLAYYANLYLSWGEVYSYLQNYIFVLITGFFLVRIGYAKILEKLERSRNEDSKWLAKLMTPLVAVSFFFAPIPESEGLMSATVVQKMIRYFVQEGNAIADRASAIGTNVYMKKLYASVGAMGTEGEKIIREAVLSGEEQKRIYEKEMKDKCKVRFPDAPTFQVTPAEEARIAQRDPNQRGYEGLITFGACRAIEQNLLLQRTLLKQNKIILDQIEVSYGSDGSNLKTELTKFNTLMQNRQNELGWVQSTMIASAAILVESLPLVDENSVADQLKESNDELINQMQNELKEQTNSKQPWWKKLETGLKGAAGAIVGYSAYFMLPGADSLKNALQSMFNKANWLVSSVVAMFTTPLGGIISAAILGASAEIGAIIATIVILKKFLERIPVVVASVAAMLAFIGYIVELAKYFYISPFIVAYAMTTRNVSKIMDFLSTGLIIFFKPTLIVIFIYFAMFMHSLIFDVFTTLTTEQFGVLKNLNTNFILGLNVALFEVMLNIIASLGAVYIMWKLILTGPAWTVSLLGLKSTDNIMSNLENKLETRSFNM
jgi:hypothetical protein